MRGLIGMGVAASLIAGVGCSDGTFTCADHSQCQSGGADGFCEPSGGCSFPDSTCASGRRYGEYAPGSLGGQCVPPGFGTGATETSDGTGDAGSGPGSTITATSTMADASTTAPITATGDSTSTGATLDTGEDSTGSEITSGSTGPDPTAFFDPFDRPDGGALGNGWIEKTPAAFRILDEQVELDTQNGLDFRNNLFYRPLSESVLDVEATMVVNFTTDDPWGYPQLHLRVQGDVVDTPDSLSSYAVFVDSADLDVPRLTVNRIDGPGFGPSVSAIIEPAPLDADRCRLHGRVTGTDPVVLEGFFEVWDGDDWQLRTEVSLEDSDPERLVEAGTVGGGGHLELQYFVLDDFAYTDLGG